MVLLLRPLPRLVNAPSGPRYLLRLPMGDCRIPGWCASAILVLDHHGRKELELTLYERDDPPNEDPDGPQAA